MSFKSIKNTPPLNQQRILIFTDSFTGRLDGIAASVESLVEGLIDSGHVVGVVAPACLGQTTSPYNREATYWRVASIRSPVDAYPLSWPSLHRFRAILEDFQPTMVSIQSIGPIGVAGLAASREKQYRIALSWHTDFESYVENYPVSWAFIAAAAARLLRRIENIHIGAIFAEDGATNVVKSLLAALASSADVIVAPSVKTASYVRRLNETVPVFVLPTGITLKEVSGLPIPIPLQESLKVPHCGEKIVYLGRLSREKDLGFLFRSMKLLIEQKPRSTLILVGPCNDRETRRLLRHYKDLFGANLVLAGPLSRKMLLDLYCKADVFVLPSATDTQSLALWEAVLCGIPAVVRDGSLCEVFDNWGDVYCGAETVEEFAGLISAALDCGRSSFGRLFRDELHPTPCERAELFASMFSRLDVCNEKDGDSYFIALNDDSNVYWRGDALCAP